MVAVSRAGVVPHAVVEDAGQGVDGNDRDDGERHVHHRCRFDLRLAPDRDQGNRRVRCLGVVVYAQPMGFSDACQPVDAVRGLFLEPMASIVILVPVLMPVVHQLGIDGVHFGLIMVLNLMIGLLHPPMGMVLFVLPRIANLSFERTTIAILPWLIPLLLALILVTYIPGISLWLPRLLA